MKIFVKVLQGQEFSLDINNSMSVLDMKRKINELMKIPISDQKLLHTGSILLDTKLISEYPQIKEGTKLNLVVKRSIKETSNANSSMSSNCSILKDATRNFLKKYLNDSQSEKVSEEFIKEFNKSIQTLSLDDLEKLATTFLLEEGKQT